MLDRLQIWHAQPATRRRQRSGRLPRQLGNSVARDWADLLGDGPTFVYGTLRAILLAHRPLQLLPTVPAKGVDASTHRGIFSGVIRRVDPDWGRRHPTSLSMKGDPPLSFRFRLPSSAALVASP